MIIHDFLDNDLYTVASVIIGAVRDARGPHHKLPLRDVPGRLRGRHRRRSAALGLHLDGARGVIPVLGQCQVVVEIPGLPAPLLCVELGDQRRKAGQSCRKRLSVFIASDGDIVYDSSFIHCRLKKVDVIFRCMETVPQLGSIKGPSGKPAGNRYFTQLRSTGNHNGSDTKNVVFAVIRFF